MRDYHSIDTTDADGPAVSSRSFRRGDAPAVADPRSRVNAPQVLARIPSLATADPIAATEDPADDFSGRWLTPARSKKIIAGGATVVVLIAVSSFLFSDKGKNGESAKSPVSVTVPNDLRNATAENAPRWSGTQTEAAAWQQPTATEQTPAAAQVAAASTKSDPWAKTENAANAAPEVAAAQAASHEAPIAESQYPKTDAPALDDFGPNLAARKFADVRAPEADRFARNPNVPASYQDNRDDSRPATVGYQYSQPTPERSARPEAAPSRQPEAPQWAEAEATDYRVATRVQYPAAPRNPEVEAPRSYRQEGRMEYDRTDARRDARYSAPAESRSYDASPATGYQSSRYPNTNYPQTDAAPIRGSSSERYGSRSTYPSDEAGVARFDNTLQPYVR